MKTIILFLLIPVIGLTQNDTSRVFMYKDRDKLEKQLINNVINKKLALPLSPSTEAEWEDAFFALQYLNRKNDWIRSRIEYALNGIENRSSSFQRGLLEVLFGQYPNQYNSEVKKLLSHNLEPKVFAMAVEYLIPLSSENEKKSFLKLTKEKLKEKRGNLFFERLLLSLEGRGMEKPFPKDIFKSDFLPGNVLLISVQRENRNFPGLVVIRDRNGNYCRDTSGKLVAIPQLARSLSGLPGYLTNGNTPEGILRMDGLGISYAGAIGPTKNIQLTLPAEYNSKHFLRDSTLSDTVLTLKQYQALLPEGLRNHPPFYEAFFAGKAGRHEIIAHGTTVKPDYYEGKSYYPFTPTLGCLVTFETWNDQDRSRIYSEQQVLINELEKAGGPDGYAVILDLDSKESAITLEEVEALINPSANP